MFFSQLSDQVRSSEAAVSDLQAEVTRKDEELGRLRAQVASQDGELNALRTALVQSRNQITQLRQQITQMRITHASEMHELRQKLLKVRKCLVTIYGDRREDAFFSFSLSPLLLNCQ